MVGGQEVETDNCKFLTEKLWVLLNPPPPPKKWGILASDFVFLKEIVPTGENLWGGRVLPPVRTVVVMTW